MEGNDPAFPIIVSHEGGQTHYEGLSKREYFAAIAMHGLCSMSTYSGSDHPNDSWHMAIAKDAVLFANALISELNKEEK